MRILYVGSDERSRVIKAREVKFLVDGFRDTDKRSERVEDLNGPVIVVYYQAGNMNRRVFFSTPNSFIMKEAKYHLLKEGWLDISECKLHTETLI